MSSSTPAHASTRPTCVVVDDHEAVREALGELLEHVGVAVVGHAASGAAGLHALRAHRPRLAILDLDLPDMTGLEIAREARQFTHETAFVLHTANAYVGLASQALASGIRAVVVKAAVPSQLLAATRAVLAGQIFLDPALPDGCARCGPPSP